VRASEPICGVTVTVSRPYALSSKCWSWFNGVSVEQGKLSGNLVLGPEPLAVLRAAFDAAWEVIAPHDGSSPALFEVARLRLANAVLATYRPGTKDPAAIKAAAVQSFAAWHPGLLPTFALANALARTAPSTRPGPCLRPLGTIAVVASQAEMGDR